MHSWHHQLNFGPKFIGRFFRLKSRVLTKINCRIRTHQQKIQARFPSTSV